MTLYDALINKYGYSNPFSFEEIKFNNYSLPWIKKELNKLVNSNFIVRYERGIYYIPEKTIFGNSSFNPQKIIEKKYLSNNSGYYSGLSFANKVGITTQMPNVIEIYTNNEKSRVREITINNLKVILRKSRVNITNDNIYVLSFLELMNSFSIDYFNAERKELIINYIKEKGINRKEITKYSPFFPDKVMRNLVESEIIYDIVKNNLPD